MGSYKDSAIINPLRIKEAREYNLMSMQDLSDKIGVTRSAISQFEKKISTPNLNNLHKISVATNFPLNFFYKPHQPLSLIDGSSIVYFRGNKSKTDKTKKSFGFTIQWADEIKTFLSEFVSWFQINMPKDIEFDSNASDWKEEVENTARDLREFWNLGCAPINDFAGILENNGFILCQIPDVKESVEAYSGWVNGTPYIFFSGNRTSAVSYNFSIAHELGHLLLHKDLEPESKGEVDLLEKQANYFAGAFLLPESEILQAYTTSNIHSFIPLKSKWKVSLGTLIFRAKDLKIITNDTSSYLFRQLTTNGYRKKEPLDDELVFIEPSILCNTCKLIVKENIVTKSTMREEIALSVQKVIAICSLPPDFFDEYSNPINNTPKLIYFEK